MFGPDANQEAVYAEVSPLVISVLDGYNACIFAYGQVRKRGASISHPETGMLAGFASFVSKIVSVVTLIGSEANESRGGDTGETCNPLHVVLRALFVAICLRLVYPFASHKYLTKSSIQGVSELAIFCSDHPGCFSSWFISSFTNHGL